MRHQTNKNRQSLLCFEPIEDEKLCLKAPSQGLAISESLSCEGGFCGPCLPTAQNRSKFDPIWSLKSNMQNLLRFPAICTYL